MDPTSGEVAPGSGFEISIAILLFAAAGGLAEAAAQPVEEVLDGMRTTTIEGAGFTRVEAHHARAGHFAAVKPDDWNGDLLVWLHGGPAAPHRQPVWCFWPRESQERIVREMGFGLACASFRGGRVGFWAVHQDRATLAARALFARHFGPPDDVYLAGVSAGAFGALKLIESDDGDYAGFLSVCGGLGGVRAVVRHVLHVREVFESFYPDVLPGHTWDTPALDFRADVVPRVTEAVEARPDRAHELAGVDQIELPGSDLREVQQGVLSNLRFSTDPESAPGSPHTATEAFRAELGGIPVGNHDVRYSGSSDDAGLNERIRRFTADSAAENGLARMYEPVGLLRRDGRATRVLAVHNSRDPIVTPRLSVRRYESLLERHGDGDLLEVRLVDRFGHCNLTPSEIHAAFGDLVRWVRTGAPPQAESPMGVNRPDPAIPTRSPRARGSPSTVHDPTGARRAASGRLRGDTGSARRPKTRPAGAPSPPPPGGPRPSPP